MAPKKSRKKSKSKSQSQDAPTATPAEPPAGEPSTPREPVAVEAARSPPSKTWYGGTWPRSSKAAPVTQVARESTIPAAGSAVTDSASSPQSPQPSPRTARSPSLHLTKSAGSSHRASLADTSITKINVTSNESVRSSKRGDGPEGPSSPTSKTGAVSNPGEAKSSDGAIDGKPQKPAGENKTESQDQTAAQKETAASSWFDWFSKPQAPESTINKDDQAPDMPNPPLAQISASQEQVVEESTPLAPPPKPSEISASPPNLLDPFQPPKSSQQNRPWIPLWGASKSSTNVDQNVKNEAIAATSSTPNLPATNETRAADQPTTPAKSDPLQAQSTPIMTDESTTSNSSAPKSSGWAFWSRDRGKEPEPGEAEPAQVGELAVSDTPSQLKPEPAVVDNAKGVPNAPKTGKGTNNNKDSLSTPTKGKTGDKPVATATAQKLAPEQPAQDKSMDVLSAASVSKQLQKAVPNLLLPSFRDTFEHQEPPSFLQQIAQFLGYSKSPEARHVSIVRNPSSVKKALAIGVHGFFPATLIRTVLGQPTGTSIKFSNMAAKAIRNWAEKKGVSCQVEKVALEGEGKIAERVDLLWKLLLNWIDDIRKADFIMIACHSQGVPVAVMLVAKLISFGCSSARIGLCCMAGVNQGPFAEYKSRFISGSAGELFEFSNPNSKVSQEYTAALEVCLKFGVKIVYAGSIDDQLVSLESSTFTNVTHPLIYRAVFVDGRVHAPSFLSHLVGLALKLRNLGFPDHGLIRELSSPLAGSIYTGGGHSRIYDDEAVYDLAVEYALETTSVGEVTPQIQSSKGIVTPNPYILPFAMRGLLEEEYVRRELLEETSELLQQFDDWKPTTKALKDVKFRLEGIRSKL